MSGMPTGRLLATGCVLLALAAVGAALVSQHVFDKMPCPWCVLQRLIFLAVALAALPAALSTRPWVARLSGLAVLGLASSGAAAALWQHFVAASDVSCKLTLADRIMTATGLDAQLPEVFMAYASCADGAVTLFGVPYEFFALALQLLLMPAALRLMRVRARPRRRG